MFKLLCVCRYNCFLCNFDICSGCAKSIEAQNIGQNKAEPGNPDGLANERPGENSQRGATEFGGDGNPGGGGVLSSPSLDEAVVGESEKEKKMELNIMEEMREDLTIKDDARMVEEMRMREELKMKEDLRIREEIEAREELKLSEERRLREELKIEEDMMVQQRMKLKGLNIKDEGMDLDADIMGDENQNTTLATPLRQGSLILEDDNIPLIDVCISSEEEEEDEEEVAPLPELDPWRPKSASLSLRQDGGGGGGAGGRGGRNRGSISSLGIGVQDGLGMALLAKNPNMVNSPDIFHLRLGPLDLCHGSHIEIMILLICSGLHWSRVRTSFLLLCQEKPFQSLFSLSRRSIAPKLLCLPRIWWLFWNGP